MNRGSLLIVTLWIVTILGALSVAVARYLSTEVRLTRYRLARQEARELARSGVLVAQQLIRQDSDPVDWSEEPWAQPLTVSPVPGRTQTVTITDEERKLNVNTSTSAQLTSLLLGDSVLAQAIVDHMDPPAPEQEDRPTDDPPYYAKNGPIAALEELNDVPDMDDARYQTLTSATTPFTAGTAPGGPLNLNTVDDKVLEAVGLRSGTIQTILQYRSGTEHFVQTGLELISFLESQGLVLDDVDERNLLASQLFAVSSQFFLVVSEGAVESPNVRVRIQAVIQRGAGSETPKITAWKEL